MKKFNVLVIIVLFVTLYLTNDPIYPYSRLEPNTITQLNDSKIKNLTNSPSILIYSDNDLINSNFPGNGTINNPYRIENLLIEYSNYGIFITSVHLYFVIQNCVVQNTINDGIIVQNVYSGYGNISFNTVINANEANGIFIQRCGGITICNNSCSWCGNGITVKLSSNCVIAGNVCTRNLYNGINVEIDSPNCLFMNNLITLNYNSGLIFENSGGSLVYDNILEDNYFAIYEETLDDYRNFDFTGNTIDGKKISFLKDQTNLTYNDTSCNILYLINCSNILVENLHIQSNIMGIFSYHSNNCTYFNNVFTQNIQSGLYIYNSNFTNIISNSFIQNEKGFFLAHSFHISIVDNQFSQDGIFLQDIYLEAVETILIENNTVNGLKLGYFYQHHNFTLTTPEYGQIIFFNCSNIKLSNQVMLETEIAITHALSEKVTIENCSIEMCDIGILLINSDNITIKDSTINNNNIGISSSQSSNLTIMNNIINLNQQTGLESIASYNIIIDNCEFSFNSFGVALVSSNEVRINNSYFFNNSQINLYMYVVHNCFVYNSNFNFGDYGIATVVSEVCFIRYCNIVNVSIDGIYIFNSIRIHVMWSNSSYNFYGIKVRGSSYGKYLYNTFVENTNYAISFDSRSSHNLVHHNYFIENRLNDPTRRLSQCLDDGYNNTWYDIHTYEGNWWSNIEEYYYHIVGYAYSVDIFPLNPVETTNPSTTIEESNYSFLFPSIGILSLIIFHYFIKKKR